MSTVNDAEICRTALELSQGRVSVANGLLVDPFVKFLNGEIRSAQKEQKRLQADVTETKMKLTDAQNQVTRIKKEKESMETELLQFKTRCKALETALQNKLNMPDLSTLSAAERAAYAAQHREDDEQLHIMEQIRLDAISTPTTTDAPKELLWSKVAANGVSAQMSTINADDKEKDKKKRKKGVAGSDLNLTEEDEENAILKKAQKIVQSVKSPEQIKEERRQEEMRIEEERRKAEEEKAQLEKEREEAAAEAEQTELERVQLELELQKLEEARLAAEEEERQKQQSLEEIKALEEQMRAIEAQKLEMKLKEAKRKKDEEERIRKEQIMAAMEKERQMEEEMLKLEEELLLAESQKRTEEELQREIDKKRELEEEEREMQKLQEEVNRQQAELDRLNATQNKGIFSSISDAIFGKPAPQPTQQTQLPTPTIIPPQKPAALRTPLPSCAAPVPSGMQKPSFVAPKPNQGMQQRALPQNLSMRPNCAAPQPTNNSPRGNTFNNMNQNGGNIGGGNFNQSYGATPTQNFGMNATQNFGMNTTQNFGMNATQNFGTSPDYGNYGVQQQQYGGGYQQGSNSTMDFDVGQNDVLSEVDFLAAQTPKKHLAHPNLRRAQKPVRHNAPTEVKIISPNENETDEMKRVMSGNTETKPVRRVIPPGAMGFGFNVSGVQLKQTGLKPGSKLK